MHDVCFPASQEPDGDIYSSVRLKGQNFPRWASVSESSPRTRIQKIPLRHKNHSLPALGMLFKLGLMSNTL